jgi:hypothetical protein
MLFDPTGRDGSPEPPDAFDAAIEEVVQLAMTLDAAMNALSGQRSTSLHSDAVSIAEGGE